MYKLHTHCRSCDYAHHDLPSGIKASASDEKLIPVFDLGRQPLANAFAGPNDVHSPFYPLEVLLCPRCNLAQLSVVVPTATLYSNYAYTTSNSDTMRQHFGELWAEVGKECTPESVVEIGSNDGLFLAYAREHGADAVCGIDPGENLVELARGRGIHTFCGVFDEGTAGMARACVPPVDVVIARHVFNHVDDWRAFVKALDILCHRDSLVVIEVPYILDLLTRVEFDTVYHEHLSYLNVKAMEYLLGGTPFVIHRIVKFPVHGGSIAIMIRRRDSDKPRCPSVRHFREAESTLNADAWKVFSVNAYTHIQNLGTQVIDLLANSKTVAGYGASAKSTVWLNAMGFTRKEVKFICDSTPGKWHKESPGTGIPITDEGALLREMPDYAILFSWNYEEEILTKNKLWREKGGKFIVPIPELRIV
jgi:novobiocin biosynthesis protein NovU/D-mycarose 3-C-methyltransferase